jgi:hypothetical protein
MLHRRGFLSGLVAIVAAPAIVRIENIMPVRPPPLIITPRPILKPNLRWISHYQALMDWHKLEVQRITGLTPTMIGKYYALVQSRRVPPYEEG